uniref:Uncharacterized protein n=1 Tax=Arundo donax TaxID=35708 RepID=A0A0A9CSE3_ARUDO
MVAAINMAAVFGEAKPENDDGDALSRRPVLFRAHAEAQGPLRVATTDLHSLAWHCSLDIQGLVPPPTPPLIPHSFPFHAAYYNFLSCIPLNSKQFLFFVCWHPSIHPSAAALCKSKAR